MHRLYANTVPFYIRNSSVPGLLVSSEGARTNPLVDTEGQFIAFSVMKVYIVNFFRFIKAEDRGKA